jgi:FkbM family methyltransferase
MTGRLIKSGAKRLFRRFGFDLRRIDESTVFDERRYLWLTNFPIRTVLDIGANIGQSAVLFHRLLPNATIYSFEPIEHCYEKLKRNVAGVPVVHTFNVAIGDTRGDATLYRSSSPGSSSLLPMEELHWRAFPSTEPSGEEKVTVARLDDWADGFELEDEILMKIDVQGYEDRVLAGGGRILDRTRAIIAEVSFQELYVGQPLFHDIYDRLRDAGFRFMGSLKDILNPLDGSVLQADAVFIRKD